MPRSRHSKADMFSGGLRRAVIMPASSSRPKTVAAILAAKGRGRQMPPPVLVATEGWPPNAALARERLAAPLPRRLLEDVREREIQLRGRGYKHAQPQLLREDADGERLLRIGLKQQHGRSHAIFLL